MGELVLALLGSGTAIALVVLCVAVAILALEARHDQR